MTRDDDQSLGAAFDLSALDELLADQATVGLDDAQSDRLAQLGADSDEDAGPGAADDSWERAAAAVDLAMFDEGESPGLPDLLARRLQDDAREFFGAAPAVAPEPTSGPSRPAERSGAALAWTVAALCAAAALLLLLTRPKPGEGLAGVDEPVPSDTPAATTGPGPNEPVTPVEPAPPTPAELRAALLSKEGTVQLAWTATEDAAAQGASGDVVWNDAEQMGYMLIRGLAVNDVETLQYQLWIFDPNRDERYPVDGGVFDIPAGAGEIVVPIDAKLAVAGPSLFAITVEEPGGVVVSSRERIVLLAKAGS